MNDLINSCNAATTYPKNLTSPNNYQHTLQEYVDLLDQRGGELFDVEDVAALDFWELDENASSRSPTLPMGFLIALTMCEDFRATRICKAEDLKKHLHFPPLTSHLDPKCRYM
jgi:hypothetical protein